MAGFTREVGEILSEYGFDAKIVQEIVTVIGKIEIDVIAKEEINGRVYSMVSLCKYEIKLDDLLSFKSN